MTRRDTQSICISLFALGLVTITSLRFVVVLFGALAVMMTLFCVYAWRDELIIGDCRIDPRGARHFVFRGLGGAFLFAFVTQVAVSLGMKIDGSAWPFVLLAGYTVGSMVLEFIEDSPDRLRLVTDPLPPPAPAKPVVHHTIEVATTPSHAAEPAFRFATWDDEEELRR